MVRNQLKGPPSRPFSLLPSLCQLFFGTKRSFNASRSPAVHNKCWLMFQQAGGAGRRTMDALGTFSVKMSR